MRSEIIRKTIAEMGNKLGPEILASTLALFDDEQKTLAAQVSAVDKDIAYGGHERQVLDIYPPSTGNNNKLVPVIVFVHGGGFSRGNKGSDSNWHNANVGRFMAKSGYLGIVINYRLAPEHSWPSGGEDVALVVDWIKQQGEQYQGDPNSIFLFGTSAGAVHIATYIQRSLPDAAVKGLILLSGLYGFTPLDERDELYYGEDFLYESRMPKQAIIETNIPLFIAGAELDPPRFQHEFNQLSEQRLHIDQTNTRIAVANGHNHFSISAHLGSSDTRLSDQLLQFISDNHL